ncbi:MAG: hypothetical protein KBA51_00335 [Kiritimatiellae bacterium]|nr:hypothetical protein [Kiritimatiellia bacterium]
MTTGALWGWIGGIVGSIMGLAGGVVGTRCSIRNASGPRERAFMIKASFVAWGAILIFLILMIALPDPWRWFLWIPYSILLPLGIIFGNRRQQAIRREESQGTQNGVTR